MPFNNYLRCPACGCRTFCREAMEDVQITIENEFGLTDEILTDSADYAYTCKECGKEFDEQDIHEISRQRSEIKIMQEVKTQ